MPYLSCPRCRLTLYSAVAYAYPTSDQCPRCSASLASESKRLLGWRRSAIDRCPLPISTRAPMIVEFQERTRLRMRGGGSFDDVEAEIIERSGLDERQKAALWLYAWSFVPKRIQRAEAARLAARQDGAGLRASEPPTRGEGAGRHLQRARAPARPVLRQGADRAKT